MARISYEHWHRHCCEPPYVKNKVVLDIACGEGYGCQLLGRHTKKVVGMDKDAEVIAHARERYSSRKLDIQAGTLAGLLLDVCGRLFVEAAELNATLLDVVKHQADNLKLWVKPCSRKKHGSPTSASRCAGRKRPCRCRNLRPDRPGLKMNYPAINRGVSNIMP